MKTNRRNFLKTVGVTGGIAVTGGLTGCIEGKSSPEANKPIIWDISKNKNRQTFNMSGYAAPKIDLLRIGYIGIGGRGLAAVKKNESSRRCRN